MQAQLDIHLPDDAVEHIAIICEGPVISLDPFAKGRRGNGQVELWRVTRWWFDGLHTWAHLRRVFNH